MLQGLPGFSCLSVGVRGGLSENIPDSGYKYLDEEKVREMCARERRGSMLKNTKHKKFKNNSEVLFFSHLDVTSDLKSETELMPSLGNLPKN